MRVKRRTLLWILWIIFWIISLKIMAIAGMVYERSVLSLLIEGMLSCLAAYLMVNSPIIKGLIFIYLIINLLGNLSFVGIFCFITNIALYYMTKKNP